VYGATQASSKILNSKLSPTFQMGHSFPLPLLPEPTELRRHKKYQAAIREDDSSLPAAGHEAAVFRHPPQRGHPATPREQTTATEESNSRASAQRRSQTFLSLYVSLGVGARFRFFYGEEEQNMQTVRSFVGMSSIATTNETSNQNNVTSLNPQAPDLQRSHCRQRAASNRAIGSRTLRRPHRLPYGHGPLPQLFL
jgi:hypothetical protein